MQLALCEEFVKQRQSGGGERPTRPGVSLASTRLSPCFDTESRSLTSSLRRNTSVCFESLRYCLFPFLAKLKFPSLRVTLQFPGAHGPCSQTLREGVGHIYAQLQSLLLSEGGKEDVAYFRWPNALERTGSLSSRQFEGTGF